MEGDNKHCYNCEKHLEANAKYCSSCGQKHTTGKVSIKDIFVEFARDYLHLDTKLPRTLYLLFLKPGELTVRYFEGKHQSYLKPVRLFGVSTLLFLAFFIFKFVNTIDEKKFPSIFNHEREIENVAIHHLKLEVDTAVEEAKSQIRSKQYQNVIDTVFRALKTKENGKMDSLHLNFQLFGRKRVNLYVAREDMTTMKPKTFADTYKVEGFWERLTIIQQIKVVQNGKNFPRFIAEQISWMFFAMMPFFALLLKFLYLRRKRYYVEHLIFAFHYHAFFFLTILLALGVRSYFGDGNLLWLRGLLLLYTYVYLYLAMKKVYQQGYFKTFLKYLMLLFSYFIVTIILLTITVLVSFMLF